MIDLFILGVLLLSVGYVRDIELFLDDSLEGIDTHLQIVHVVERGATLFPPIEDEVLALFQSFPALDAPFKSERLDIGHLQRIVETDNFSIRDLVDHKLARPVIESMRDDVLEWSLECNISDLELACTIGWNEDKMDAWMPRSKEEAELLALVHRPDVEHENDARVSIELVQLDASLGVWQNHLLNVLSHRRLVAPVILAEGDVRTRSNCLRCERREGSRRLPLEDKLERKEIAFEGGSDARRNLTLVLRTDEPRAWYVQLLVGTRCTPV